jgi:hypothetical protein
MLFCFCRGNEIRSNHSGNFETRKGLSKSITKAAERTGIFEKETSQGESDCPEATLCCYREDF